MLFVLSAGELAELTDGCAAAVCGRGWCGLRIGEALELRLQRHRRGLFGYRGVA